MSSSGSFISSLKLTLASNSDPCYAPFVINKQMVRNNLSIYYYAFLLTIIDLIVCMSNTLQAAIDLGKTSAAAVRNATCCQKCLFTHYVQQLLVLLQPRSVWCIPSLGFPPYDWTTFDLASNTCSATYLCSSPNMWPRQAQRRLFTTGAILLAVPSSQL